MTIDKEKYYECLRKDKELILDVETEEFSNQDNYQNDKGKTELLEQMVLGYNSEQVMIHLQRYSPEEIGGQTALRGFYYQFLVAIEYLVDVLNNHWDYLALEFHDDIVVGKEDMVRFIQVKTSKRMVENVTNTELYRRKVLKRIDKKSNNSWVDKLLSNSRLFQGLPITIQFELVTNFSMMNTDNVNIDIYHKSNFSKEIQDNDYLYKQLSETCFDKNGEEICYEDLCGLSLKEMLGNLRIITKSQLSDYIHVVCNKLSESIGLLVRKENIDMIIGEMCLMCINPEDPTVLFIDKAKAEEIRLKLVTMASNPSQEVLSHFDFNIGVREAIQTIRDELASTGINREYMSQLEDELYKLLAYLTEEWAGKGKTKMELLSRYLDGKRYSFSFIDMNTFEQARRMIELIKSILLLNLIFSVNFSDEYESILVKQVSSLAATPKHLTLLGLKTSDNLNSGLQKLATIIEKNTTIKEKIQMLINPPLAVLQGEFDDDDFQTKININLKELLKPKIDAFPDESKISEVTEELSVIPGNKILKAFRKVNQSSNIEEFKLSVQQRWDQIL